jgi:putative colanic acid biosynthesis acetyltransferase WcaB
VSGERMNTTLAYLFQDWEDNPRNNPKGRLVLVAFRLAQRVRRLPMPLLVLGLPYLVAYRVGVEWVLGIELRWKTAIGPHTRLEHGQALVIHDHTVIGAHCTLRHSTTIGNKGVRTGGPDDAPRIGNHVDIGANSVIIGSITIGDHVIVGAGSVVTRDVPSGSVVAGNPARILRHGDRPVERAAGDDGR